MIKRLSLILLVIIPGCANPVSYTVSERYGLVGPYTVAILPLQWAEGDEEQKRSAGDLIRTLVFDKLRSLNYAPLSLEEVDSRYRGLTPSGSKKSSSVELARLLGVDGVLYIEVTQWDEDLFVTYASLKVGARFELYSNTGERLWKARYKTKESDLRLDRTTMELAVIKAYEPRLQRIVDSVFATLPSAVVKPKQKKFFDWLP